MWMHMYIYMSAAILAQGILARGYIWFRAPHVNVLSPTRPLNLLATMAIKETKHAWLNFS